MVVISIIGVRTVIPKSMLVCAANVLSPSTTSETSKLVAKRNGETTLVDLELAWKETRELPAHLLELARVLAS